MSSMQYTIFPRLRLLWPILAGLALAYLASGFVEYQSPPRVRPDIDSATISHDRNNPSWESVIFEKNILNLEIPGDKPLVSDMAASAGPDTWVLLGALTGARDMALVSVEGDVVLVSPGQNLKGWELYQVVPRSTVWKSGAMSRNLEMWQEREVSKERSSTRPFGPIDSARSQKVSLSSQEVQPFLNDPNTLLQMAHFSPYEQDGERGFEINDIRPGSMLQKLGFRNRDVLTRIDGRLITGPTELLRAYSSLTQSSLVTMDILRQGQNVSFVVEIN